MDIVCAGQAASGRRRKLAEVLIDLCFVFDCVSHSGLLFKLRDAELSSVVSDVIAGFLFGRIQRVVVDGVNCEGVRVVSGVPYCSMLSPLLFLLYTSDLLTILA